MESMPLRQANQKLEEEKFQTVAIPFYVSTTRIGTCFRHVRR